MIRLIHYVLMTTDHPSTPFKRTCRHFYRYVNKLVGGDMVNMRLKLAVQYLDKITQICDHNWWRRSGGQMVELDIKVFWAQSAVSSAGDRYFSSSCGWWQFVHNEISASCAALSHLSDTISCHRNAVFSCIAIYHQCWMFII